VRSKGCRDRHEHCRRSAFGEQRHGGKVARLFFGRAGDGVERVALRFGSRTVDVPITGRWFLAEFPERPDAFLSYDAAGRVLEERKFEWPPGVIVPVEQPQPEAPERELARIHARGGSEECSLLVVRASDGGYCQTVRSDWRRPNEGCSIAQPKADEIGVSAMNFGGGAPDGILLLVGPVGSGVAKLVLRYENGRSATLPLSDGWVLYEVEPADYTQGRRPEILIASDASGREIASERLPSAAVGG
jgi:hypothetical protein